MKFTQVAKDIYLFPDICNVYVIKSGELGLLIDLGTGDVLDHLKEIGINKIEWVLSPIIIENKHKGTQD
jgi:hypothetical protein